MKPKCFGVYYLCAFYPFSPSQVAPFKLPMNSTHAAMHIPLSSHKYKSNSTYYLFPIFIESLPTKVHTLPLVPILCVDTAVTLLFWIVGMFTDVSLHISREGECGAFHSELRPIVMDYTKTKVKSVPLTLTYYGSAFYHIICGICWHVRLREKSLLIFVILKRT